MACQPLTGTDGAQLAVVESGELLSVDTDLLPVLDLSAPHSNLVRQKSLVDLQFLPISEILVARKTFGRLSIKQVKDTETARYGDAARLSVELTKIFASVRFSHILDP